jgi:opacity protein-like surface antigen
MTFTRIALIAVLSVPALAGAQDGGFSIKGGLSYGNVSNSGALPGNISQRTGFAVGVGAVSGGTLGFGVDALYAQRGIKSSFPGASRNLDYIDVPVYARLMLPLENIAPFGYAGPQVSFELKCTTESIDCPDTQRAKINYAGIIGAGLQFTALHHMALEARYVYGLSDLKLSTVTTQSNYQTRSFMLLVGFGF